MSNIALTKKIIDFVDEYNEKHNSLKASLEAYENACKDLMFSCTINGVYGETNIDTGNPTYHKLEQSLKKSAWRNIYRYH